MHFLPHHNHHVLSSAVTSRAKANASIVLCPRRRALVLLLPGELLRQVCDGGGRGRRQEGRPLQRRRPRPGPVGAPEMMKVFKGGSRSRFRMRTVDAAPPPDYPRAAAPTCTPKDLTRTRKGGNCTVLAPGAQTRLSSSLEKVTLTFRRGGRCLPKRARRNLGRNTSPPKISLALF